MKNRLVNFYMKGVCLLLLFSVQTTKAVDMNKAFRESRKIERQIKRTKFPDHIFNVMDYGAQPNSPDTPCHEAINNAIIACNQQGGGTVVIPSGVFYSGPITLKSNVNLHLADDAVLKFLTDKQLYTPSVITRWEGMDCYNFHPLIYAYGETNIALTGKGVIDGQGANDTWWYMKGRKEFGWREGLNSQAVGGRDRLMGLNVLKRPVYERIMTEKDALRPQLINFYRCNTILVQDVTLLNSPFWVIHPLFCESMIVSGVKVYNRGPNGDGCDPESSKNILIENCQFDTGDDCIAIKSGRNEDGRKWNVPSENIIVRNCFMKNGHGGVVIGSEISGGFRNLFVEDCVMNSPELERVIRIKTNTCRGGVIENVFVRNVKVGQCEKAILHVNLRYEAEEDCQRGFNPYVRNVHLQNVTCDKSECGLVVVGLEEDGYVSNISIEDCTFNHVKNNGNIIENVTDIKSKNLYMNGQLVESLDATNIAHKEKGKSF